MFELLTSEYRPLLQDALALSVCLAAFLWGRGPERILAAAWLVLFELAIYVNEFLTARSYRLTDVDLFLAGIDAVAACVFVLVALNANRNYPLYIAALQVLAITAHLARGMIEAISPIAYVIMVTGPGWLQLCVFAIGLSRHIRREKRFGRYRDWRVSHSMADPFPLGARGG